MVSAAIAATHLQSAIVAVGAAAIYGIHYLGGGSSGAALPGVVLLISLIGSFYTNLVAAPLAARMDYRFISQSRMAATLLSIAAGAALACSGASYWALVARDFVLMATSFALLTWHSPLGAGGASYGRDFRSLARFNASLWLLTLLERLALRLDYALVGFVFGKEGLGIYFSFRAVVEGCMAFLIQPIQTVVFAYHCRHRVDRDWLQWLGWKPVLAYFVAVALLGFAFRAVGAGAIRKLFGPEYMGATDLVLGLSLYAGAMIWFEYVKVVSVAEGVHNSVVGPRLLQILILLPLVYALARVYSFQGAALATGIAGWILASAATFRLRLRLEARGSLAPLRPS